MNQRFISASLLLLLLLLGARAPEALAEPWANALKPDGPPGPALRLARDGTTDYRILLPAAPTSRDTKAAEDLARWLREMSGATFPIVKEDQADASAARFISIGRTARLAGAATAEAAMDLGDEGYAIVQRGDGLFLFGGRRRGPIHAVYALLEEDLGCRWYTRGSSTIRRLDPLTLRPVTRTFVPALDIRDPFYWDAFDGAWSLQNRTNSPIANVPAPWGGHMQAPWFTHGLYNVIPQGAFNENPQYFAEIDGQRSSRQLCLTSPDVLRITLEKVRAVLDANPHARLLSIADYDGGGHCECAGCKALDDANGSPAGSLITFVNQVGAAIEAEYPDVFISTLAYLDRIDAPTQVRPRRNVAIQLCNDLHSWRWPLSNFVTSDRPLSKRYRDAIVAWTAICPNVHIWDYFVNFSHYMAPMPNMHLLAPSVAFYVSHGVKGIMFQGAYQGPGGERAPMRCWVMAKLLWDPARDVEALQRDFITGYYQEAAPPIAAYNAHLREVGMAYQDRIDEEMGGIRYPMDAPFLDRQFIDRADGWLSRAEALAPDEQILRRVQVARLPIWYVKLVRGPAFAGGDYASLLEAFEAITSRENVRFTREGAADVPQQIDYWRGMATVDPESMSWHELGNAWKVRIDPMNVGEAEAWYAAGLDEADWAVVRSDIDRGWESQGFAGYTGHAWYRQRITVPDGVDSRRFFWLLFGAVDEDAEIYIDGTRAFEHTCASTGLRPQEIWILPFKFDARPHLKAGREHLIAVRVNNRLGMGGIWKPVYLVAGDADANTRVLFDLIRKRSAGKP